tara:strand:- start:14 stop:724 length:711 start_codon:yes stop_codon:yes gene_type:complete
MNDFWNDDLPPGYYDIRFKKGLSKKRGVQSYWHLVTFQNVSNYVKLDIKHLDYACGPGTFIGLYSKNNSIGVDLSKTQIDYAIEKNSNYSNFLTLEDFDFHKHDNSYDLITVMGLIEFIDDKEILDLHTKLIKMLNNRGKIIYTTPNFKGLMFFLEKALNFFGKVDYSNEHINKFDEKKLEKLFSSVVRDYKIKKFVNISIFFSYFSHNLALRIEKFIGKITNSKYGSLMLIEIDK